MNARNLFLVATAAAMVGCTSTRPAEPRESPAGVALATGEPAGGESAPIAGRVDLPPQQPRR